MRAERRLSQEQLAELADMSVAYVSGIERGLRNVSVLNLVKLAEALRCRVGDLFPERYPDVGSEAERLGKRSGPDR
jgi:transcriptional regulator with XRE-family HTH domain